MFPLQHFWAFRIGGHLVYLDGRACVHEGAFSIDSLKVEVACVYYLQISDEKRAKGLSSKFFFLVNYNLLSCLCICPTQFGLLLLGHLHFIFLYLLMGSYIHILLSRSVAYHWGT